MAISTTLQEARRLIWPELGEHDILTATSTSAGADAKRTITCSDLIADEIADSAYSQAWVYCASSAGAPSAANVGVQRRARKVAINGTTGALTLTAEFPGTPQAGDVFEVTKRMPAIRYQGHAGLREAINAGLATWNIVDLISMTGVANQYAYALAALPFMGDEARVLGALDPPLYTGANPAASWRSITLRHDFEAPYIEISSPYNTGEAWQLRVYRAANTRIYNGSAWVDSTTGLVDEDDAARVEPNVIRLLGLWKAYEFLTKEAGSASGAGQTYAREAAKYGAICQALKRDRDAELGGWPITPENVAQPMWAKNWVAGGR